MARPPPPHNDDPIMEAAYAMLRANREQERRAAEGGTLEARLKAEKRYLFRTLMESKSRRPLTYAEAKSMRSMFLVDPCDHRCGALSTDVDRHSNTRCRIAHLTAGQAFVDPRTGRTLHATGDMYMCPMTGAAHRCDQFACGAEIVVPDQPGVKACAVTGKYKGALIDQTKGFFRKTDRQQLCDEQLMVAAMDLATAESVSSAPEHNAFLSPAAAAAAASSSPLEGSAPTNKPARRKQQRIVDRFQDALKNGGEDASDDDDDDGADGPPMFLAASALHTGNRRPVAPSSSSSSRSKSRSKSSASAAASAVSLSLSSSSSSNAKNKPPAQREEINRLVVRILTGDDFRNAIQYLMAVNAQTTMDAALEIGPRACDLVVLVSLVAHYTDRSASSLMQVARQKQRAVELQPTDAEIAYYQECLAALFVNVRCVNELHQAKKDRSRPGGKNPVLRHMGLALMYTLMDGVIGYRTRHVRTGQVVEVFPVMSRMDEMAGRRVGDDECTNPDLLLERFELVRAHPRLAWFLPSADALPRLHCPAYEAELAQLMSKRHNIKLYFTQMLLQKEPLLYAVPALTRG